MAKRGHGKKTRRDIPRKQNKSAPEIVGSAQSAHVDAVYGLEKLRSSLPAQLQSGDTVLVLSGLKAMVTSARQVVLILRLLKRIDPFQGWLAPIEAQIDSDPLLNYFAELRNTIEKEGLPGVFGTIELRRGDEPVGDVYVRMTDGLHGIWTAGVLLAPSGSDAAKLAHTHDSQWLRSVHFADPPKEHLGKPLWTDRADVLGDLYLAYLWYYLIGPARQKLAAEGF
jgi:hypothetical protein